MMAARKYPLLAPGLHEVVYFGYHPAVGRYPDSYLDVTLKQNDIVRRLRFLAPVQVQIQPGFNGQMHPFIQDISDRQLDHIKVEFGNWEVMDPEISFQAYDVIDLDEQRRLEIHPGKGIGPIAHGMRPAEVQAVFPEPQVYEGWMGGNLNDALLFRGLRIHFSDCDGRAPLPNSKVIWIVIHQREDASLFGRPVGEWTKDDMVRELRTRGFDVQMPSYGSVVVPQQISMSFDEEGRLVWVEV